MATYTYGNSGNRWWVGLNVTSNLQTFVQTGNPRGNSTNGYESLPSGNATDDALFAAAAKKDANSKNPVQISVENIEWFNIQGPFTTQAAANAAIPGIQQANPAPGVAKQVANANIPVVSPVANALLTATSWEQALQHFIIGLTSVNLWTRVAKVVIGGALFLVGISKLTHLDEHAGSIASKAVRIAPFL